MSEKDFDFYLRIAFQSRAKSGFTLSNRQIIGQFGVGFLAVFPFCQNYYIESSKSGSSEVVYANIPSAKYFTKSNELIEVDRIQIPGGKKIDNKTTNKQFTKIILSGFTALTKEFFFPKHKQKSNRFSIKHWKPIDRLTWILSEDLPIEYSDSKLNELFDYPSKLPFNVSINTKPLKRLLHAKTILETHAQGINKIGKIKFKYCIATDFSVINPPEARYFKVRNLNVGVGQRETFGAGTESGTRASLTHLTGEIHIISGMNDQISLDRDKFNYDEDYEELKEYFRNRLVNLATHTYEINKFSKETKLIDRLGDVRELDKNSTLQKIQRLEKRGFKVIKKATKDSDEPIAINKKDKIIVVSDEISALQKEIQFNNKKYFLDSDSWDYKNDKFPAVRINRDNVIINKSYPLFKGIKYTDVFFRFHLLLTSNLINKNITEDSYQKINEDIIKIFQDYLG